MDGDDKAGIASYTVITEKELSIVGKKPGRTVLNLWFVDPKDAAKERVLSYLVQVFPDPQTQVRLPSLQPINPEALDLAVAMREGELRMDYLKITAAAW